MDLIGQNGSTDRTVKYFATGGKWRPDIYNNMVGILKYIRMIFNDALN